jgi:hypothetical protein
MSELSRNLHTPAPSDQMDSPLYCIKAQSLTLVVNPNGIPHQSPGLEQPRELSRSNDQP